MTPQTQVANVVCLPASDRMAGPDVTYMIWGCSKEKYVMASTLVCSDQGRTDHLETRALPEGPGSVGGPMRCPWYLFHRLF
ncbi:unnamed protein product [Staurois parvus]|uniref:Uncharacterized protein n=1 Tax=Staurois parvus TaxID=386267 RepID=A0ABN9CCT5_9NEOB|nr:unnamed protein product [Staurois parvus]